MDGAAAALVAYFKSAGRPGGRAGERHCRQCEEEVGLSVLLARSLYLSFQRAGKQLLILHTTSCHKNHDLRLDFSVKLCADGHDRRSG